METERQHPTRIIHVPNNCKHPNLIAADNCKAKRNPEYCDCRWCVFHSRFNKANEQHGCSEGD